MKTQGDSNLDIYKRKFYHGKCIYGVNVQQALESLAETRLVEV